MSSDLDDFLAHHGIKGMHWGRRKDRTSGGQHKNNRSRNTAIVAGSVAALVGARFLTRRGLNVPFSVAVSAGTATVGARELKKFLDRDANRTIKEISK